MIQQREEWLTDTRAYIAQRDAEQANLSLYERRKAAKVLGIAEDSMMWEELVEHGGTDGDPASGQAGQ